MEHSPFSGERLESILAEMAQDREAGGRLKLTPLVRNPQDGKPSNRRSKSYGTGTKSSAIGSTRAANTSRRIASGRVASYKSGGLKRSTQHLREARRQDVTG